MTRKISVLNLLSTLILTLFLFCTVKTQEIPTGVTYKRTSDAVNNKARQILENAFAAKAESMDVDAIFGSVIACGPLLWDVMKEAGRDKFKGANPMILIINAAKPIRKEGRGISNEEQKRFFWKLLIDKVKLDSTFTIRKAKASEIQYYWATIPFDIEEPFLIVDFGRVNVLINFTVKNGEPRIFWMDIVGDLNTLK